MDVPCSWDAAEFDRIFLWRFRARVLRVIDADTAVVLADCGFHGRHEARIRLADYSGPELREPGGEAARARLEAALRRADGSDWPLRVISQQRETVASETWSFERYVATVLVAQPDGGLVSVVELL